MATPIRSSIFFVLRGPKERARRVVPNPALTTARSGSGMDPAERRGPEMTFAELLRSRSCTGDELCGANKSATKGAAAMVKGGDPTALLSTGSRFEAAAIQSTKTSAPFLVLNVWKVGNV